MNSATSGMAHIVAHAITKAAARQVNDCTNNRLIGMNTNCPAVPAATSRPVTRPCFSTNHAAATVDASTVAMHPIRAGNAEHQDVDRGRQGGNATTPAELAHERLNEQREHAVHTRREQDHHERNPGDHPCIVRLLSCDHRFVGRSISTFVFRPASSGWKPSVRTWASGTCSTHPAVG